MRMTEITKGYGEQYMYKYKIQYQNINPVLFASWMSAYINPEISNNDNNGNGNIINNDKQGIK